MPSLGKSWPLDSPVSFGVGLCFFVVFLVGLGFNLDPKLMRGGRPGDRGSYAHDKQMGRVVMYIFGPATLLVLMLSWSRSNDTRYSWLDRDD